MHGRLQWKDAMEHWGFSVQIALVCHYLAILENISSLLAEALFLLFADGRTETSAMGRKWL